ncbi:MAG TPA: sigma-70 family RNA polymerase sigma factor [Ramlibacter sp.]|uniref:sigma-70 family RNA polymerase sigma factor n=1 Tax=Ramlibacter sp. TaxID=1917967 RepID=UPI002C19E76A|nr:sigma-70 family RNA polymerase sigma factor [Ramlibacter sp.]HVZ44242.1 sigma-70 family RNA polymerase sigma factor [Ramlibacter sp.]
MAQDAEHDDARLAPETLGDVLYADKSGSSPIPEQDWGRLVAAVAAGDQFALHALYDRTHRIVFTLIMRITGSRETAEELTLDVFFDVWRRAAAYDPANGTVIGWIMNQARSRAIDRLRFERRRKRVDPLGGDPHGQPQASDAQDAMELRQQAALVRLALFTLKQEEREAIETAYFHELSHAEVALRLNEPLGTVKTRIRSALRKLRLAFAERGDTP